MRKITKVSTFPGMTVLAASLVLAQGPPAGAGGQGGRGGAPAVTLNPTQIVNAMRLDAFYAEIQSLAK